MDDDKLNSDITNVLQEIRDLVLAREEAEKSQKELSEFVALLQEELTVARNAERVAESRKTRYQAFAKQQQEAILKLLGVKEENDSFKRKICQLETAMSNIQNSHFAELMKKEAEIQEIKQDYLNELIKVQKAADNKVSNAKAELLPAIDELRATISKHENTIEQQLDTIHSLQKEIQVLEERAAANLDTFHKKLAEQERNHQAELETWKLAELDRANINRTIQDYQTNFGQVYQHPSLVSRCKNIITPSRPTPIVLRPLPPSSSSFQTTEFLSASNFYQQHQLNFSNCVEEKESNTCENKDKDQTTNKEKTKVQGQRKKRKLFSADQSILE